MNLNFNEDLTITNNKDYSSSSECVSIIAPADPPPAVTTTENMLYRMRSATTRIIIDSENGVEAESTGSRSKLALLRYKGVVLLPNGRWGAQIYEKHQRIWLGTFDEEHEAARVYDVAAQRFYGREAISNFKPLGLVDDDESIFEFSFISSHSKSEIVDMLRKHTYMDELQQRKRNLASSNTNQFGSRQSTARESLFEKAVTPSDVGKLNRFVIPKQHAEKHFPLKGGSPAAASKGVILHFEDAGGKVWRFRYSYWKSSQSYILTKGWIKFVKEKNLQAGDVVSFYKSRTTDGQLYIDFSSRARRLIDGERQSANGCLIMSENVVFRLFGVDIVKECSDEDEGVGAVKTQRVERGGLK